MTAPTDVFNTDASDRIIIEAAIQHVIEGMHTRLDSDAEAERTEYNNLVLLQDKTTYPDPFAEEGE